MKQPQTSREKTEFITENRALLQSVERGCELMKLSSRTYYYKPKKKPSDQALLARMEQICLDFPRYGYRRVTKQQQREWKGGRAMVKG